MAEAWAERMTFEAFFIFVTLSLAYLRVLFPRALDTKPSWVFLKQNRSDGIRRRHDDPFIDRHCCNIGMLGTSQEKRTFTFIPSQKYTPLDGLLYYGNMNQHVCIATIV